MQISFLTSEDLIFGSQQEQLVSFHNKERCLAAVFWSVYDRLEKGQKTLLIADSQSDLEVYNYLMSKHGLRDLTIIIDKEDKINRNYLLTKSKDEQNQKPRLADKLTNSRHLKAKLKAKLSSAQQSLQKLHIPQLGNFSITTINDKLEFSQQKKVDLTLNMLRPPYDYETYKEKKRFFEQVESHYSSSYPQVKMQDPFHPSVYEEGLSASLDAVLSDLLERATQVEAAFEKMQKKVQKQSSSDEMEKLDGLHKDLYDLRFMMNGRLPLTDTQVAKLVSLQTRLFSELKISSTPPTMASELPDGLAEIEAVYKKCVQESLSTQGKELNERLSSLNPHTANDNEVLSLIQRVNALTQEVTELGIFDEITLGRSTSIYHQKKNLFKLLKELKYALFFLEENKNYTLWRQHESQMSAEDYRIMDHLVDQNGFWGQAFENLFLQYYLANSQSEIESAQDQIKRIAELGSSLTRDYALELVEKYFESDEIAKMITFENWSDYLEAHSAALFDRFPIVIMDSAMYATLSAKLIGNVDNCLFLNQVPQVTYSEEWLQNISCGYDPLFRKQTEEFSVTHPDTVVMENTDISYQINRSFKQLPLAEVNRAARYLGQELTKLNEDFKIYQLKNLSLVSFLSDEKNAAILDGLKDEGIKGIISNASGVNLLPGLFTDQSSKVILLIEDGVFSTSKMDSVLYQQSLIQDIKLAGLNLISIDNHKMISHGFEIMNKLISHLRTTNGTAVAREPAMA